MTTYPSDWKVVPLGEVGDVAMCRRVLKSQTMESGDVPFFKIGTFGRAPGAYISHDLYESLRGAYSFPKCGDVLVSAAGTIGRTVVYDGEDAYYQDSNIVWIENDESKVLNSYLYWWYKVIEWKTENGGTVDRLYNKNFLSSSIAYPPLPEQKRIAGVLGDMDKLIENLGKRIEKKRQIKKGAMQELLTGKKRLSGFTGEWKQVKLGEVASLQNGYAFKSETYNNDGAYTVITIANVQDGCFDCKEANRIAILPDDIQEHQRLKIGDVLVSMTGNVGRVCRVNSPNCLLNQRVGRFDVRGINIEYFYAVLRGSGFLLAMIEKGQGGAQPNIGKGDIEGYEIPLPPTLAEQRAIAKVLSDMDAEIANLERRQEKLKQVKKGMLQDLLTGKVRLKGQGGAT